MNKFYSPKDIELIVQKKWFEDDTFKVTENFKKKKFYCLSMLPYPSGNLHMGHVRNYTIGDVISRYQRMLGKNVLQPIGWDAFGLPAEEAAIKNKILPSSWTYSNIEYMRKQLKLLGFSFDWNRELITCSPEYYKWEQWFFIYLYKKGLIYKNKLEVNWCPKDKTVLANEQVVNGFCWRCESKIEYKKIPQWFMKITAYADELLDNLKKLDGWPKKVIIMQKNWIGKSEVIEITFKINNSKENIIIYTNRSDIFLSVTYIALSIYHPFSIKNSYFNSKINNFIKKFNDIKNNFNNLFLKERKGIDTGIKAIHPLTKELLPIWITNFVINDFGTEAMMCVPCDNKSDFIFAKKYKLLIKYLIIDKKNKKLIFNQKKTNNKSNLCYYSLFKRLNLKIKFNNISNKLIKLKIGKKKIYYRLRDWVISRQRYWGTPIPMITLNNGDIIPIPKNKLPVILPENISTNYNLNMLKLNFNWIKTIYKGQCALRETDTFDTFMESSWYYARYTCPNYNKGMLDTKAANYWLPVDQYIGGIEHAIMHLMYFRFYHKLLRDSNLVKCDEPANKLLCQGMVLSDAFYYINMNRERVWVSPKKVVVKRDRNNLIIKATHIDGKNLIHAGMIKMSKSKNNGINPQSVIKKYGADTIRLFVMFAAPIEMNLEWNESGIEGSNRFLKRIWKLVFEHKKKGLVKKINKFILNTSQKKICYELNNTIMKVSNDIKKRQSFNTAIATIMEFTKKIMKFTQRTIQDRFLFQESLITIIKMLYPFTPHICFILWKYLGCIGNIDYASWPIFNKKSIFKDKKLIIIQINGKLRGKIIVPINSDKKNIYKYSLKEKKIANFIKNFKVKKIIYIKDKLINLVLN